METADNSKKRGLAKGTLLKRSNAYPFITLSQSLEIAEVVYKNAGNSYLSGEQIAKILKRSFGSITQKLGSCVQYGLLELKSKVGYRSAEICKQIFKPINEAEKRKALVECFQKPKLYAELITKFSGSHLPSPQVLPNILDRHHNVFDEAATRASNIFFENLRELNLLNSNNEIALDGQVVMIPTKDEEEDFDQEEVAEDVQEREINRDQSRNRSNEIKNTNDSTILNDHYKTDIPLTEGKKAVLYYPSGLNENDLQLLKGQIDLLGLYIKLNLPKNE